MAIVREIKYFDYMEDGHKLGNAGHVRVDWWDNGKDGTHKPEGSLYIRLNHLPEDWTMPIVSLNDTAKADAGSYPLEIQSDRGNVVLGNIGIEKGAAEYVCSLDLLEELLGADLEYAEIRSLRVDLGGKREVYCAIHEESKPKQTSEDKGKNAAIEVQENAVDLSEEESNHSMEVSDSTEWEAEPQEVSEWMNQITVELGEQHSTQKEEEMHTITGPERQNGDAKKPQTELGVAENKRHQGKAQTLTKERNIERDIRSENKWGHLCAIYPKLTPFSDSREYLEIGPNDLVLLNSKYYSLIHNSFLLHGYYQYGKLVLCRVLRRGKALYYLGTPGIYLEREKQVAIMYGFQSFECETEPAMEGDLGYYMIQVEL